MPVHVLGRGHYELFETVHRHRILVLNGRRWFAWVKGELGEILVRTDSRHTRARTLLQGKFLLVDFEDDPKFKDMPHLFLQKGDRYRELLLPDGLPSDDDPQKRIVSTRRSIPVDRLERYLAHPLPPGPGEERVRGRMRRPGGSSIANVAHYLRGVDFPASRVELIRHASRRRAPRAVLTELEKIPERRYASMAAVAKAIGEAHTRVGRERDIPVPRFNDLPVPLAAKRMRRLSVEELRRIKQYELAHKHRKTLLATIDRLIVDRAGRERQAGART